LVSGWHSFLGWNQSLKGLKYKVNGLGFRGNEFTVKKPKGVIRIIALGGSTTLGLGSRDPYTYPAQLERLLLDSGLGKNNG